MLKDKRGSYRVDFLKIFKKSLAASLTVLIFGMQTSYASNITDGGGFNTQVSQDGNTININGGTIKNDGTGFHHFGQFELSGGDIANMHFGDASRFVNLVDNQVRIDGIFNALKNGAIGGDVIFVSAKGMIVGATGIMNVGSLQTITPVQSSYDRLINLGGSGISFSDIQGLASDSKDSETEIYGKIFASGGINIAESRNLTVGDTSLIVSGFNANGFAKTAAGDVSGLVNSDGIVDASYMTNSGGGIKIVANNINSDGTSGLIQSMNDVNLDATAKGGITLGAKIKAGGDVNLGQEGNTGNINLNNKIAAEGKIGITSSYRVTQNEDADISAGSVTVDTGIMNINSNIVTNNGISINASNGIKQSDASEIVNNTSGDINLISYLSSVETNKITNKAGDITIGAGALNMKNTIDAQNGSINITAMDSIAQKDDTFTSLNAKKDLNIVTTADVGNSTQSINVNVGGDVDITNNDRTAVYLKSKDSDLSIKKITMASDVNLESSKKVTIKQNINANKNITIKAQEGVSQTSDSTIKNTGGGVTIENGTSGNVDVQNIDTKGGGITVANNASDGKLNINGNVTSNDNISLSAQNGINQSSSSAINLNGTADKNITLNNNGSGDVNINNIFNSNGNISVKNTNGGALPPTPGSVNINGTITANAGTVGIESQGNISQSKDTTSISAGSNVTLDAQGNIGTEDKHIIVSSGGELIANAVNGSVHLTGDNTDVKFSNVNSGADYDITTKGNGDIVFDKDLTDIKGDFKIQTDNDLNIDNIIHAKGDVSITSNGGDVILNSLITSTDQNISVNAEGGIFQKDTFDGTTLKAEKDINLTANTGDVGSAAKAIQLESKGKVAVNGGNVYLTSPGSLNISGINKDKENPPTVVNVSTTNTADGNINFSGLVKGSDVTISAAQAITQNTGIKSVEASGDLYLQSKNGSIGQTDNAINFSAGTISADSSQSVVLTGVDTDIKTSLITAKENIDLSTQIVNPDLDKGKIIVENNIITSENGYIRLNSAKSLELNNDLSAGKSITLNATGGIVQGSGTTITSGTNAAGGAGSGKITITNKETGDISLNNVTSNLGDIEVANNANTGNIVLNSVLNASDSNIILNSKGDIIQAQANNNTSLIAAGDISLTALNAGTSDKYLLVNADGSLNAAVSEIYAQDNTGDFTLGTVDAANSVNLKADGNIIQSDYTKNAILSGGTVNLISENGNVGGLTPDKALVITSLDKVNADASNIFITTVNNQLKTGVLNAQNDIHITSKYTNGALEVADNITANGNITLNATGGINQSGGEIHKTGAGAGDINITASSGSISLTDVTNDGGNIRVINNSGAEEIILNSVLTAVNGDITLNANGSITQNGAQTSLSAGNNITINSSGNDIGNADNYLAFSAGNELFADSGNGSLFLKTSDSEIKTSNISSNGNIGLDVSGTGNFIADGELSTTGGYIDIKYDKALNLENKLSASDYIKLAVNGAVTQKAGLNQALVAGTDIILDSNGNNIGADGNSLSVNAAGKVDADGSNIYLKTPGANLNAGNINATGDVKLSTENSGDINLKGLINGNTVTLNAVDGIYQTTADKSINASGALSLTSQKESVGKPNEAINFSAGSVSASAEKSVVLLGVDTDISTASISAKENIDLSTRVTDPASTKGKITVASELTTNNGYIKLDSAKSLEIDNNIEAGQHITLNANGGIVQNPGKTIKAGTSASAADGTVTITNAGAGNVSLDSVSTQKGDVNITNTAEGGDVVLNSLVQASTGSVNVDSKGSILQSGALSGLGIDALNNISLTAVNSIGSGSSKIVLNAGGDVTAGGSNIYLKSPNKSLNLAEITSNGIVDISTDISGDINIKNQITGSNITLDAADGIYQTGTDKTITASGILNLTANNGDLGRENNALVFKADSVKAKAQNGSVILNGVETDINTDSIVSSNNIDLTTTTSGNINVTQDLTASGYIKLNSADQINVQKNITSTGSYVYLGAQDNITLAGTVNSNADLTLDTQGNIIQTSGSLNAVNDIILKAAENIGASGQEILTAAGGVLNASGNNLFIKDTDGDFVLGEIKAVNTVNLIAAGDMVQNDRTKPITAGADITLKSTGGDIGKSSVNSITVDTAGMVNAEGSNIYLASDNDLNTGAITASQTGNVDIRTTGENKDIVIKKLIKGGNVVLNANRNVRQDSSLNKTIETKDLTITAQNGNIGETDNAVDFSATGTLGAHAEHGSVVLNGIDTNIYTNSIIAGKSIDLSTEHTGNIFVESELTANDGYIRLNSVDGLTLSKNIQASDYISLISQTGNILLDSLINAGTDITLDAHGTITQGNNAGILTAGQNIIMDAVGDIGVSSNKIKLNAGNTVTANGANIYLDSPDKTLNIAGITSSGTVDVSTTTSGDINIKGQISGDDITLNAVNGIYQDSDTKTVTALGDLSLIAQNNDIGRTDNAIIFEAGTINADAEHGSVVLNGIDTDIHTGSITAGKNIDLSTTNSGSITLDGDLVFANGYIKLDSAESLTIDKTLTSSDYIYLGAKDGLYLSSAVQAATDITINTQGGITQTAGSVTSTGGKIQAFNDVSGGITLNNVTAQTGMNIVNSGNIAALITIGGLTTARGTLNVANTTGGNVVLASLIESTNGNVSINADEGNVVQTGTSPVITAGRDIFLAGNEVGSESKYINTNAGGAVSANGVNIYLENDSSEFRIGNINTNPDITNKSVNIKSNNGDIKLNGLVKGDSVNIASSKNIKQDIAVDKSIDANTVNFTANGNIGEISNAIDMTVLDAVNVVNADNVYLHGADTGLDNALNIGNINASNDVILTSDSGIKLNGLIHSTNADLTAVGNITQDVLVDKSFETDSLRLTSTGGDIGETGNAIDFTTGLLYADAAGSVVLNSIGRDISTDTIRAGMNIDLSTTGSGSITIGNPLTANGYIRLNSAEALTVDKNLHADSYIELTAQNGEMILSSLIEATDVTLNAAGGINQQSGQIISSGLNGVIANNTTGGGITLTDVTASNGGVTVLNSADANGKVSLGTINAYGNVSVSNLANNGIELNSNLTGADISLISTGGVIQNNGNITSSGTNGVIVDNKNAGAITINNLSSANGNVEITNRETADGRITLGSITSGGNVSVSNLSNNDIVLNSNLSGADVSLVSTGGVAQNTGNITSSGTNGVNIANSNSGGIKLNNVTASNGAISVTNDDTAVGSLIVGALDAKGNVSLSNLSESEIRLNSTIKGADISLISTGGISQNAGAGITSTGTNGVNVSNSTAGGIQLNDITAADGSVTILNDETGGGSIIVEEIRAGKNISISNLSDNEILLNAGLTGADISLISTGGIIQQNGNISSTGSFNAQNSTSGGIELNNITASNGVNIENTALDVSDIELKAITNANGLVNIKNATGGDILLTALVQSTDGSIVIDSANGNIEQTLSGIALKAGDDITLKADSHIGTSSSFIKMNAGGDVYLQGENIYIDSPDADLNIAQIRNESGTVNIKTSGTSGALNINDEISAENIALSAIGILNSNANIAGQNALSMSGSSVIQKAGTAIAAQNGTLSVNSSNGDLLLDGNVSNTNGNIVLANNSAANGSVRVNNVNAGTSYTITNNGNGLVTVNGTLTNNADSTITANNLGASSGIVISDGAVLNNKNGTLNVTNKGQKGTILGGTINNNFSNGTNVNIRNEKGAFDISANINNGAQKGSANSISLVNNGISLDGVGLNIISGTINNYGKLNVENNSGIMNLAGAINAQIGSENTFVNGADSDMNIQMSIDSYGNTFTFENRGTGSLIIGEDAVLSVYSVNDGGTLYKGELNLNNISVAGTQGGGITINGTINNGNAFAEGGVINIANDGNGGANDYGIKISENAVIKNNAELNINNNSTKGNAKGKIAIAGSISGLKGVINIKNDASSGITFENGLNVSTGSSLNVINNKGSINVEKGANVNSSSDVYIANKEASQSVNFDGKVHGKNVNIESSGSNINIAHNSTDSNISTDNNLKITAQNADILNHSESETAIENAGGISAGGNIELKADNIGLLDTTLNDIIDNGFVLDPDKSIHISAGGNITADSTNVLNLLAVNGNLNLDSISAQNAILSALNGNISGNTVAADNLYAYAKADSGKISLENMNVTSDIYAEAGSAITMNSNSAMNIQSILSRNDTINITSEGNADINEIAAAKDINVTVKDEKLTIINLGRVKRAQDIIPENVNLTVLDSKRTPSGSYTPGMSPEELENVGPNSKLDIYNAYVQNKATLKADTITAQVYDISDSSTPRQIRVDKYGNEATGFHNANKNGKLLEFDIQGANYAQGNAGSNPPNHFYTPDPDDKHALNVHLTLGDSVGDALFGATFKKLYSDYAFIDSINKGDPSAFSRIVLESGIIGQKAIFRNNLLRLDIDNTTVERDYAINKHYDDEPDKVVTNKSSFNMEMYDTIIIDKPYVPDYPQGAESYNPHRRVTDPNLDEKMTPLSAKEKDSSAVEADKSTGFRQINWLIKNKNNDILGSSDANTVKKPVIDSVIGVSKAGLVVIADTTSEGGLKKGENLQIDLKYKEIAFNTEGIVTEIDGRIVNISFVNVDKLTSTVMLFLSMLSENL